MGKIGEKHGISYNIHAKKFGQVLLYSPCLSPTKLKKIWSLAFFNFF